MDPKTLLGILGGFLLLALILYLHRRKRKPDEERLSVDRFLKNAGSWGEPHQNCASCMANGSCSASGIPKKKTPKVPVYYDDDELDRFIGRSPESYSPEDVKEFLEVYNTLLPEDRLGWFHSLKMRGIAWPESLQTSALEAESKARVFHCNAAKKS